MATECLKRKNERNWTKKDNINRFFFPEEYMKFEDLLKRKQLFSVRFLMNTGARIMEAQNVLVEDCDLDRRRIILRITKIKAKKKEKICKPRIIPISTQFAKYLRKYIKENNLKNKDYLGILKNNTLNEMYKIKGKKAKIKDYWNISSHTFRKTLEVWLMALDVKDMSILAHLGHDLKTAMSNYVSPDIFNWEDKEKIRKVIGDLYLR